MTFLQVRAARDLPFAERLARCADMKATGNENMRNGRLAEACQNYEQARNKPSSDLADGILTVNFQFR